MAVSASALGMHVVSTLDNMMERGWLGKAAADIWKNAIDGSLRKKLLKELRYSEEAENWVLEDEQARKWVAELRQALYQAEQSLESCTDEQAERPSILAAVNQRFFS